VQAAEWLRSVWQGHATAAGRNDVRVWLRPHANWAQPSVIAMIQGTQFPKEAIVIGGHLDSINTQVPSSQRPTASAPGADDDASGVASLTETFRSAMATGYQPARTVFFMAYAAEEVGLLGSTEIAQSFVTSKYRVIGKLQFDMTNFKGSSIDIGILKDASHTNLPQNQFLQSLIDAYKFDIVPGPTGATYDATTQCGYACSDHAPWNARGFPASIAFESRFGQHSTQLHKPTDTLANADPTAAHAVKFSKLGAAYMAELAKGVIPPPVTGETARQR
jgi:leucyl aminopeptidase